MASNTALRGAQHPIKADGEPQSHAQAWALVEPPITSIGGDADRNAMLSRVVSLARLHDGRVLVWEPRPAAVRLFDQTGRFLSTFAREGSGPGEVRDAMWIGLAGDTILIHDRTQRRLTRFTATGEHLSSQPFRAADDGLSYSAIGRWPNGSFVLRSTDAGFSGRGADGVRRDSVRIAVADASGNQVLHLMRVPGMATFTKILPGGGAYVSPQPFGATGLAAAGPDLVWVGDNSHPVVFGYDRTGKLRHRVTVPFPSLPVDRRAATLRRDRELAAARNASVRALVNEKYAALPNTLPYFNGLVVGPNGDVWVTSAVPFDSAAAEAVVLSPAGTIEARLRLPPRFRIVLVDADVVTGVYRDEDDVEFVRVYRIRR